MSGPVLLQLTSRLLCIVSPFLFALPIQAADLNSNKNLSLFDLPLEELMNVQIYTAGKTSEKIKNIPASVVLITRKDIERYGYTTLTDVLENTPGLYNIYSYAGVSGNFGVRGFWNPNSQNSNVAILVNGVSQVYDNDRTHPLDKINVPVESIDRIEVIRGPMAVLYGNGAAFGVINIITNDISDDSQNLVSLSYGELNTKKASLRISGKENDLKFVINAGFFKYDGLNNKFSNMMSPGNVAKLPALGITDPNYSTKNLLTLNRKYLGLSGSYNHWIYDVAYNETQVGIFLVVPPLNDGYLRRSKNTSMMLGYQNAVSKIIDVDVKVTYNTSDRDDLAELLVTDVENSQVVNSNSYEFEFLSTITPNDKINIIAGINYRTMSDLRDVIVAPSLGIPNESFEKTDRITQAIFTQATYQVLENLSLVAGLRYEDLRSYKTNGITDGGLPTQSTFGRTLGNIQSTSPRLAAIYTLNTSSVVKFLYGEANRLGDDILKPEITKTTEINYIYSTTKFYTSVSMFRNQLQDLVIKHLVFENGSLVSRESNGGEITTNGIELIINGDLTKRLFGEFSITVQDSEDQKNKNIEVGYSPKTVSHAKLYYTINNSIIALIGRYVGSMETFYDLTKQNPDNSYGARTGNKINSYVVLDLNIRQDNIYKSIYLNFKINNILDKEIRYPNNQETNELLDRGTIGLGRTLIATIGMTF
ncbi:MAG: TonB-dependent receptor plug domain-containing protein [Thiohalomonadales bacterium]